MDEIAMTDIGEMIAMTNTTRLIIFLSIKPYKC